MQSNIRNQGIHPWNRPNMHRHWLRRRDEGAAEFKWCNFGQFATQPSFARGRDLFRFTLHGLPQLEYSQSVVAGLVVARHGIEIGGACHIHGA